MAAARTRAARPSALDETALAALAEEITARVVASGAAARSSIAAPPASQAALMERLAARGLETRPKFVRVPLTTQLDFLLAQGPVPVKGLEKRLAGGATRAEARAALERLVKAGTAVVLRGSGRDGDAARPPADLLESVDRGRIAALAKALSALASAPGRSALAPRARWEDVRALLADVGGGGPPPATAASVDDRLLVALRTAADPSSGISSVSDAVRAMDGVVDASELGVALKRLASRGVVELRIASQPHLLSAEARELCPTDPGGRVLAYARVVEG